MSKKYTQPEICRGCCFATPTNTNFICSLKPILNNEQ